MASTGDDYSVRLWDPKTGESQQVLRNHAKRTNLVAFRPCCHNPVTEASTLKQPEDPSELILWDYANDRSRPLPPTNSHLAGLASLADNVTLVAVDHDGGSAWSLDAAGPNVWTRRDFVNVPARSHETPSR
ncbi:MAG TPA: hypothetical protein VFT74_13495 [Isosphaeraceae bacterium]|nr:hypothetical protein [Isosphaeraceae bacterium]